MTDIISAIDSILGTLKVAWDANAATFNAGTEPVLVFEATEPDLKPHPRDTAKAWARAVVRHMDSSKVTLVGASGARYRRTGIVWVQVFVPATDAAQWTVAQELAAVAQMAYEGNRAGPSLPGSVVFTKATILDRPKDGAYFRCDCKVSFTWDEIKPGPNNILLEDGGKLLLE